MKNILLILTLMMLCFSGCKTTKPVSEKKPEASKVDTQGSDATAPVVNFSDQTTWLLGYIKPVQLSRDPYSIWYNKGFDTYTPGSEALNRLFDMDKSGLSIKIVMGTWCPDSRREVPRFMKVLSSWQFPEDKVTLIGVDNAKNSPVGEYNKLDIQRVPTFIIYKNNIEAGRIIENPTTSLEQDIVNILTRNEK